MTEYRGRMGSALLLDYSSLADDPRAACTLDCWLITAPEFHPLWDQYMMSTVRLSEAEGFPPPHLDFLGATHELLVVTLDPEHGPYDQDAMLGYAHTGRLPHLAPVNIHLQFEANDAEMNEVMDYVARAIVDGVINPETADAPDAIREQWLGSVTKTLAHIRGEQHAP